MKKKKKQDFARLPWYSFLPSTNKTIRYWVPTKVEFTLCSLSHKTNFKIPHLSRHITAASPCVVDLGMRRRTRTHRELQTLPPEEEKQQMKKAIKKITRREALYVVFFLSVYTSSKETMAETTNIYTIWKISWGGNSSATETLGGRSLTLKSTLKWIELAEAQCRLSSGRIQ
jgi:hypothetical protein